MSQCAELLNGYLLTYFRRPRKSAWKPVRHDTGYSWVNVDSRKL